MFAALCGNPEKSSTEVLADGQQINNIALCIQSIIQPQTEWNPVLSVAKWAELEIIMLSEISQAQKTKFHMSFSIGGS